MLLLLLSLTINFYICNNAIYPNCITITEKQDLQSLKWILGEWQSQHKDYVIIESWSKRDDSQFDGSSIKIQGRDTIVLEQLQINQIDGTVYYIADVKQNTAPVKFKLITKTDNSVVFENKEHDFPQQIKYELYRDDLKATISGPGKDGKIKSIDFNYKRKI